MQIIYWNRGYNNYNQHWPWQKSVVPGKVNWYMRSNSIQISFRKSLTYFNIMSLDRYTQRKLKPRPHRTLFIDNWKAVARQIIFHVSLSLINEKCLRSTIHWWSRVTNVWMENRLIGFSEGSLYLQVIWLMIVESIDCDDNDRLVPLQTC